jgi:hypothetical protein
MWLAVSFAHTPAVSQIALSSVKLIINPLNAELNPFCHLLALLGAHHIFHVSGLRVKLRLTPCCMQLGAPLVTQCSLCCQKLFLFYCINSRAFYTARGDSCFC